MAVSYDETVFSAVGLAIPAKGQYGILLVCLSLMICVKTKFQKYLTQK